MYYAHSQNQQGHRQELAAHLRGVAELSSSFAAAFDATELGRLLGLYHDIGKYSGDFQSYLLAAEAGIRAGGHGPDHKAAGAQYGISSGLGLAAMALQGHHGGLKTAPQFKEWIQTNQKDASIAGAAAQAAQLLTELRMPRKVALPPYILRDPVAADFYIRMLFSALVDADFLDTERHFSPERAPSRGTDISMRDLLERLLRFHEPLNGRSSDPVGQARDEIYQACLTAAELPPGLFRLAAPTGGGKTISAMAFALRHAAKHGHRRVIVGVPFISITEQTADVYRSIFGADESGKEIVLEHHSGVTGRDDEGDAVDPRRRWQRLAAENWDAPIVVTTTVQLFESIFAAGPGRCRKLHNLARSVILLDEAQSLPPRLLGPILSSLKELCSRYGATVLLSTATQPAFDAIPAFGEIPTTEVLPNAAELFRRLKRVEYEWRTDVVSRWEEIAGTLRRERQAMAILNTKRDALSLLQALDDPLALHLSTLLCGAHRRDVIKEVGRRLSTGNRCILVSTQVVEAGVNLDFPLVARALAPLDSIIQAAGRCNREGKAEKGRVLVFRPEGGALPRGSYRTGAQLTASLLAAGNLDPDDPATTRLYFQRLYDSVDTDGEGIQKLRSTLDFPEVEHRFKMIEDDTESVVIASYGTVEQQRRVKGLVERLAARDPHPRALLRQIQPYLVTVRRREAERYRREGLITPLAPGVGEWQGRYDTVCGLVPEDPDPDAFVI